MGGIFGEEFFVHIVKVIWIWKELICLSRLFCQDFVSMEKDKKFRSLEVRRKLIALKNIYMYCTIKKMWVVTFIRPVRKIGTYLRVYSKECYLLPCVLYCNHQISCGNIIYFFLYVCFHVVNNFLLTKLLTCWCIRWP